MFDNTVRNAVIEALGYSEDDLDQTSACYEELIGTCQDISNHGIDGGFGNFIYHMDTVPFGRKHREAILAECKELADDCGLDGAMSLIAGFGCLDDYDADDVARAIYEPDDETEAALRFHNGMRYERHLYTQVYNALAWFAAEEVARSIADD